jgi:predicted acylesterase/phospholipase RssA/CRP-like cAMP-binding protein
MSLAYSQVVAVVPAHATHVSSTVERLHLLSERPACSGLDPQALEDLNAAFEPVHVAGGARVMERGQSGVPFILVAHGGLHASYVDDDGRRHVVFEYFRGATLGEALVLSGHPSPFDVHAIRESELLCLRPEKFNELAGRHPGLALQFARVVATRMVEILGSQEVLSSFRRKADRIPRCVALVTGGTEDMRRTRALFADALSRSRVTTHLTWEDARRATDGALESGGDGAYSRFLEWLGRREGGCDLLLLECEAAHASWLDFCVEQADRIVVLVGDEERLRPDGEPKWWRKARLADRSCHLDLAIVHPRSESLPRGGATYRRLAGVSRLHHVRAGDSQGAESLARWVLDRPVGLVFGGGGARGIAHVGVMKALEEARIPVDIVGGTSMGAIFAGGLARGWSADIVMDHVRRLFSTPFALYDPTIPFAALLAGKKLDRVMDDLYGDIDIADLWTPFFCVSTNISRAYRQVHDSGSLRDAIRSSCSLPGVFPPFQLLKQLLVDGGLVDNLPIDIMAESCRGPIVAVDVYPYERHKEDGERRPRKRLVELLARFKPFSYKGPWLFDVLMHATLVGSQYTTTLSLSSHPPALYLVPELEKFRVLDWGAYEPIFQAGYASAKRAIEAGGLPRTLWEGRLEDTASR